MATSPWARRDTVGLSLTNPNDAVLGTPSTATLTIVNDEQAGTIEFDQAAYTVNESAGIATITLRRTGGLAAGVTAMVSTLTTGTATAGADYTAFTNKVVTFAGGATTASFTIAINNDTLAEADETVVLQISSVGVPAAIGAQNTTTLTIQSDDIAGTVQFSASNYNVTEGTATATITVNRVVGTSSGTTVWYRDQPDEPGTATGGGSDYTMATGMLSFNANETAKTFTVAIVNDTVIEAGRDADHRIVQSERRSRHRPAGRRHVDHPRQRCADHQVRGGNLPGGGGHARRHRGDADGRPRQPGHGGLSGDGRNGHRRRDRLYPRQRDPHLCHTAAGA